jgi:hypothetical protein
MMKTAADKTTALRVRRVARTKVKVDGRPATQERGLSEAERAAEQAEAEPRTLISRLAPLYTQTVKFYIEEYYGPFDGEGKKLSDHDAYLRGQKHADELMPYRAEQARDAPPQKVSWDELNALAGEDFQTGLDKWEEVKQAARDELASGMRIGDMCGAQASPYQRAQFLAVHEQLAEGWQPQNGVEWSLVDMLAQTFSLYLYWSQIAHMRAVNEAEETQESVRKKGQAAFPKQYVADSIEQAYRLADGYHRQYMRTLRQMRDLRRYTPPVIVNNGGQVNVATDGGQQVNVAK